MIQYLFRSESIPFGAASLQVNFSFFRRRARAFTLGSLLWNTGESFSRISDPIASDFGEARESIVLKIGVCMQSAKPFAEKTGTTSDTVAKAGRTRI